MTEVLIGNACSLCAAVTDSISGTRKKPNQILAIQMLSQVFYGVGTIILKGYSSTVQNAVAILRNLAAIKQIKSKIVEWILILLGVGLGIVFNNLGWIGWLPIVANLEYSIAVFQFKNNPRGLKIAFIINMLMYFSFSVIIMNYVAAAANIVVAVVTAIALIKGGKPKTEGEIEDENGRPETAPQEEGSASDGKEE